MLKKNSIWNINNTYKIYKINKPRFLSYIFYFSDKTNSISQNIGITQRQELKKMIENKDNVLKKQVKGSGPGGQHVNKTASTVLLKDLQTNISVKVGNSRDSTINSHMAKKRLLDKLDLHYNGSESKIAKKIDKIKKQKERLRRKSSEKHNSDNKN